MVRISSSFQRPALRQSVGCTNNTDVVCLDPFEVAGGRIQANIGVFDGLDGLSASGAALRDAAHSRRREQCTHGYL